MNKSLNALGFVFLFACAGLPTAASAQVVIAPSSPFALMGGEPSSSFIGVGLADIDDERARALKLHGDVHGVEITRIEPDSPAAKAGLKTGDVVLEYNGQRVEGIEQFVRFVHETPPGRHVSLVISRDGATQTVSLVTAPSKQFRVMTGEFNMPHFEVPNVNIPNFTMPDVPHIYTGIRSGTLGVEVESLTSGLSQYFGVKNGVLVRAVIKDSPAEKAGIHAGDVITKVNGQEVKSPSDVTAALRSSPDNGPTTVQLTRDHRDMSLNVNVERSGEPFGNRPRSATNRRKI